MRGCRPLNDEEIQAVIDTFQGQYRLRDVALFITGCKTGFRIQELLSIRLKDVIQYGKVVQQLSVRRCNMKGKHAGRSVALHKQAQAAILSWIEKSGMTDPEQFLFCSRKGSGPISRVQAWRILNSCFERNEMQGQLGTHSMRKTFAKKVYHKLNKDLIKTQAALSHSLIDSTVKYLSFEQDEVDQAILSD